MPCSPKPGWALLSPPGCCFAYRPARVEDWVEAALRLSLWHTRSSTLWQCWAKWYGRAYKSACMHMRRGLVLVLGAYMDERSLSLPANSMKTVCISLSCILFFFSASRDEKTNLFSVFCFCAGSFFFVFISYIFLNAPIVVQTAQRYRVFLWYQRQGFQIGSLDILVWVVFFYFFLFSGGYYC